MTLEQHSDYQTCMATTYSCAVSAKPRSWIGFCAYGAHARAAAAENNMKRDTAMLPDDIHWW